MTGTSPRETTYLSRVLDLPPLQAVEHYDRWTRELVSRPAGAAVAGQLLLAVTAGTTERQPHPWSPLRRTTGELRSARGRLLGSVALELTAWSGSRTELGIRLLEGRRRPSDTYFAVGHAALRQLTAELTLELPAHGAANPESRQVLDSGTPRLAAETATVPPQRRLTTLVSRRSREAPVVADPLQGRGPLRAVRILGV